MFDATNFVGGPYPINRRSNQRYRSYLHGKLIFESPGLSADCTIRNLSQIGAKIEVTGSGPFAEHPMLLVTKNGALHETTTVWSAAAVFGLKFERSFDLKAQTPQRLSDAYKLWLEYRPR